MKKILVIFVIITTFFVFQSALEKFDDLILRNFNSFSSTGQFFDFAISGEIKEDEVAEFQETFLQLLDEFELNAYQRIYINREYILWAHTSDENFLRNILLTVGTLTAINPGDFFFSNDGSERGIIFNPIRNKNYRIYHLSDFRNPHRSIFNPYVLFTDATDAESIYRAFESEFRMLYPTLPVFSDMSESHCHGTEGGTVSYEDILFAILTGLLVILGLNVAIIRQTKKIQILKLEGYSNWQIYKKYVLRYLGLILLVALGANIGLYVFYIETSVENAMPFLRYLIMPNLIFVISLFIASAISFATILMIDVNLAVKGKSSLKQQKDLNYIVKVLLIVFTTLIVLNGVDYIRRYHNIVTTESRYLDQIENLYTVAHMNPQAMGRLSEFSFETEEKVLEHLKRENNYFELMYLSEETIRNGRERILVTQASREYVWQYLSSVIADQMSESGSYILIPENLGNRKEDIYAELSQNFMYAGFGGLGTIMIYPQIQWSSIIPYDYITFGMNITNAIFLVNNSDLFNIGFQSYFRFDGDPAEAQAYFDNIYLNYGALSSVIIESVEAQYMFFRAFFLQDLQIALPIFIMIIFAIIANASQLAVLNCEINDRRYAILKSEGRRPISLIIDELKVSAFLLVIAQTILYVFMEIPLIDVIFIISAYFAIESLLLWGTTAFQTRHFAERLR